jgi:hypothetical protein
MLKFDYDQNDTDIANYSYYDPFHRVGFRHK